MDNHQFLLGTLRKKGISKEVQGMVAAVLDSRVRVPNPVGIPPLPTMVEWSSGFLELYNLGMI